MRHKVSSNLEKLKILKQLDIIKQDKIINRQLNCLCPFHEEKKPSFGLSLDTGCYNCFSCGERGRSFQAFFSKIEERYKVGFDEDIDPLNSLNNELQSLELPSYTKKTNIVFSEEVFNYYNDSLDSYIIDRVKNKQIRELFEIRYSKKLNKYLIPIRNEKKELIGWVIRQFIQPKYKYKSGFKKSLTLFGLDKISGTEGIITEGPLDVIKTYDNGYNNCVGLLGSDMSKEQELLILRYFNSVIIATDNDKVGHKCMENIGKRLKNKINVFKIQWITNKKDLGELTKKELELELKNKKRLL